MPAASLLLDATPSSAATARRFTRRQLEKAGWEAEPSDCVVLLVSELVTNAIVHADGDPRLMIDLTGDLARVTVIDDNPHPPVLATGVLDDAPSGRGLQLVEHLASAWGVEPHDPGKCVWFLLRRADC